MPEPQHDGESVVPHVRTQARLSCRQYVLDALRRAMEDRGNDLSWIESERLTVAVAANQWAEAHGIERRITVEDVERIEVTAIGHVDYGPKLALCVALFMLHIDGGSG